MVIPTPVSAFMTVPGEKENRYGEGWEVGGLDLRYIAVCVPNQRREGCGLDCGMRAGGLGDLITARGFLVACPFPFDIRVHDPIEQVDSAVKLIQRGGRQVCGLTRAVRKMSRHRAVCWLRMPSPGVSLKGCLAGSPLLRALHFEISRIRAVHERAFWQHPTTLKKGRSTIQREICFVHRGGAYGGRTEATVGHQKGSLRENLGIGQGWEV